MGREAKITYEQVAAAADAMCTANFRPSSRALRERLGNTGSMGTINRLLQEWKATQERHQVQPVTLPAVLQRAILDFMAHELSTAKLQLESTMEEQHHEMTDLATENERQAAEIDEQINAEVALRADLAKSQGRIAHTDEQLAQARRETICEREEASKARVDLAKALLRLEAMPRLEAEIAALREELRRVFIDRAAATQQAAVLEAKLEAVRERAVQAEAFGAEMRAALASGDATRRAAARADSTGSRRKPGS
jgi:colicin import membrane protein